MGTSAAIQGLIAIAVINSVISLIFVVAILLVLFCRRDRSDQTRVKPQDADQMDRDFKVKLEPVKEEADLEVTINTLAESRCFDVAEPADDVDGDHELSVEFYPSTSPLETAFSRKMRARVSIASISSNLSKQFGRRRSMELEDGEELITSTNGAEMDSNSGSNDIDGGGKAEDSDLLKAVMSETPSHRKESGCGESSCIVLTLAGAEDLEDSTTC